MNVSNGQPVSRFEIVRTYEDLSQPVEGELKREPIADADAECPQCGSRKWLLIEKRAEPEEPFTRWQALACANCGLSDGWGSAGRARPGRKDEGWEHWEDGRVPELPEDPTAHDVARVAPFRVLAPSESPTLRSHSSQEAKLTGVTVADQGIEVTTEIRHQILHSLPFEPGSPEQRARQRIQRSHFDRRMVFDRQLSEPAQDLAFAELARKAQVMADEAATGEATFELDGAPHTFAVVETEGRWAAVAHVGNETVTVVGEGEPPSSLALRALRPKS